MYRIMFVLMTMLFLVALPLVSIAGGMQWGWERGGHSSDGQVTFHDESGNPFEATSNPRNDHAVNKSNAREMPVVVLKGGGGELLTCDDKSGNDICADPENEGRYCLDFDTQEVMVCYNNKRNSLFEGEYIQVDPEGGNLEFEIEGSKDSNWVHESKVFIVKHKQDQPDIVIEDVNLNSFDEDHDSEFNNIMIDDDQCTGSVLKYGDTCDILLKAEADENKTGNYSLFVEARFAEYVSVKDIASNSGDIEAYGFTPPVCTEDNISTESVCRVPETTDLYVHRSDLEPPKTSDSAMYACKDHVDENSGEKHWHLPFPDQLEKMYEHKESIGGFANDFYWSYKIFYHPQEVIDFSNGDKVEEETDKEHHVRCVTDLEEIEYLYLED